ncbi:riboflavin synthase domain-like protein [Ophiobolus disseminans]|uniref:Riboflavin synthase domain-like protein n=1 Tax=Ophiobolus disseminans TaxID=1469910 RepID=A0A6A6ZBI1_9PLEO|nr:riboflavin synthase domain-like protein [Ophiobolus disseminans]
MRTRYGVGAVGSKHDAKESALQVEVCAPRTSRLRRGFRQARVFANTTLAGPELSVRKHLEVTLPPALSYRTGDCLKILPQNSTSAVQRALNKFGLSQDSVLTITSNTTTTLPVNTPMRAAEVLRAYVELGQPASECDIRTLLDAAHDENSRSQLSRLANDAREDGTIVRRPSVLDLLELFPTIRISSSAFLAMQQPMRVRHYCISSSPLWNPTHVTVTYSVVGRPPAQGSEITGTASAYLTSLAATDEIFVSIEEGAQGFRLPEAVDDVPLIMIAAGIGLAPFRGFVQERAAQIAAGRVLATALLFYGCRSPDDNLYSESFERWEQLGALSVRRAYSHASEQSQGCRHVQDRVYHDRADFMKLFAAGARVSVCVPKCAVADVRRALVGIIEEGRTTEGSDGGADVCFAAAECQLEGAWHVWTPQDLGS